MIHQAVSNAYTHLILDGIHIRTRLFDAKKKCFLLAYGIYPNGKKELIDVMLPSHENERDWTLFLIDLKKAGLTGENLQTITSDGQYGIPIACQKMYPGVYHNTDENTDLSKLTHKLTVLWKVYSLSNPKKLRLILGWLFSVLFILDASPTLKSIGMSLPLIIFGESIRIWAAGTLHKTKELTVSGPYAYTRNPLYIGSFLVGLGFIVLGQSWWLVTIMLLLFWAIYKGTVQHEENNLIIHFKDKFELYKKNVPRLIPRFSPWKTREILSHPFSIPQAQKNGELLTAQFIALIFVLLLMKSFGLDFKLLIVSAGLAAGILHQYFLKAHQ